MNLARAKRAALCRDGYAAVTHRATHWHRGQPEAATRRTARACDVAVSGGH